MLQPVGISLVQIEEKTAKEMRTCLQLPLLSLLMLLKRERSPQCDQPQLQPSIAKGRDPC